MGYTSVHWTLGPEVQAPDLARSMCCVLVQNALPLQCLASPRSINAGVSKQLLEFHWLLDNILLVNLV